MSARVSLIHASPGEFWRFSMETVASCVSLSLDPPPPPVLPDTFHRPDFGASASECLFETQYKRNVFIVKESLLIIAEGFWIWFGVG